MVETTVCTVLANPAAFDGKIVRLRGKVVLAMEIFSIGEECPGTQGTGGIWLEYGYPEQAPTPYCCPGGFDAKGNPVFSEPRVTLLRDRNFRKMKRCLEARHQGKDRDGEDCGRYRLAPPECQRCSVTATLTGRLSGLALPVEFGAGFGHFGIYPAKLVIERVDDVSTSEVDQARAVRR